MDVHVSQFPPRSAYFADRQIEFRQLTQFWQDRKPRVLAIVGLGGIGKTALVGEFIHAITRGHLERPDTVFAWSLYAEPNGTGFLRAACRSLGLDAEHYPAEALLRILLERLGAAGHSLLVLDGLEWLQHVPTGEQAGSVSDVAVDGRIRHLVAGIGETQS